jgi:hypothetical protein
MTRDERPTTGEILLRDAMRRLAAEEIDLGASPGVEMHLRAHVRSLRRAPRSKAFVYIAAAASVAIVALVWQAVPPSSNEPGAAARRTIAPQSADEFLPLPYAHVPVADGQVVRIAVPRIALASFGLDPAAPGTPDVVQADVFIGEDGIARSVRFVDWSSREESTP